MCLAIPGKVLEIFQENGLKMGRMDFSGINKSVCLEYVPEIQVGQYALVHAGFAIGVVDEKEAAETASLWEKMSAADLSVEDAREAQRNPAVPFREAQSA